MFVRCGMGHTDGGAIAECQHLTSIGTVCVLIIQCKRCSYRDEMRTKDDPKNTQMLCKNAHNCKSRGLCPHSMPHTECEKYHVRCAQCKCEEVKHEEV